MNQVIIYANPLDNKEFEITDVDGDIRPFLVDRFGYWPETAHIYLEYVSKDHEVTPYDDASLARLGTLNGTFYVVVYPEGFVAILAIVAIALSAGVFVLVLLFRS